MQRLGRKREEPARQVVLSSARTPKALGDARQLLEEYSASLGIDLSYQHFAAELAGLPGAYALPHGRLLLARVGSDPAGCVALRRLDGRSCEMKRLYVRPQYQRLGLGRRLVNRAIESARLIGYSTILLDSLPSMHAAIRLYESVGFVCRAPYFDSPIAGNVFMQLDIGPQRAAAAPS